MELTELTLRLVVLLLPGAIAALIVDKLTPHRPWSSFRFILHAIILGSITYITYQGVLVLFAIKGLILDKVFECHKLTLVSGKIIE